MLVSQNAQFIVQYRLYCTAQAYVGSMAWVIWFLYHSIVWTIHLPDDQRRGVGGGFR
jgi:hypothetical protein